MSSVKMHGPVAEVRWGYRVAATLTEWAMTMDASGTALSATVTSADTFRMSQPSLTFRVIRQRGEPWDWPVESLQFAAGTLTARLGPQKES